MDTEAVEQSKFRPEPHNPKWPGEYEKAAREIKRVLGARVSWLEHIGSTSIPNMMAKPIIDILGATPNLKAVNAAELEMRALGYVFMGEYGIPGRAYFDSEENRKNAMPVHLHTYELGDKGLVRHRAFRDYLKCHSDAFDRYMAIKKDILGKGPFQRDKYQDAKDKVVHELEKEALEWAANSGSRL